LANGLHLDRPSPAPQITRRQMYPIQPGLHPSTPTQRRVHNVLQPSSMRPLMAAGLPGILSNDRKAQLLQLLQSNIQNLALQATEVPTSTVESTASDAKQFQELYAANPAEFRAFVHYVRITLGKDQFTVLIKQLHVDVILKLQAHIANGASVAGGQQSGSGPAALRDWLNVWCRLVGKTPPSALAW
ncbi:hypothetical protein GY45DRAFT_1208023, partial [Cubamyces sp. BRFM 1775]